MNALSSLVGETEAMAIRSKSLNYNYLTISSSTASLLKVTMIGVFPLLYLGIGKKFEPLLLVTIAFGMLMTNLPGAGMYHELLFAGGHVKLGHLRRR